MNWSFFYTLPETSLSHQNVSFLSFIVIFENLQLNLAYPVEKILPSKESDPPQAPQSPLQIVKLIHHIISDRFRAIKLPR
jgi:hypothetical protein